MYEGQTFGNLANNRVRKKIVEKALDFYHKYNHQFIGIDIDQEALSQLPEDRIISNEEM
jgi:hypothetical protein